jgi:hypothetical protein
MSDSGAPHAAQPASAGMHHADMQAIVATIHGMGEQRPMDTIKAFVRAVWQAVPLYNFRLQLSKIRLF